MINSNAKAALKKNIEKPSRKRIKHQKQSKTESKTRTKQKSTPLENLNKIVNNVFTEGKEGFETIKKDSESEDEKSWDYFSELAQASQGEIHQWFCGIWQRQKIAKIN